MLDKRKSISEADSIDIQSVRSRLIDRTLTAVAAFSPIVLCLSIFRSLEYGWHPVYYFQIFLVAVLITLTVFLKKLPYRIRVFILVAVALLTGISGLLTFGIGAAAFLALFAGAVAATILLGIRDGIVVLSLDICIIVSIAVAVCTGAKTYPFDANEYAISITAWALMITTFGFYVLLTIYIIGVIYGHLNKSLWRMEESEKKYRVLFKSATDAIFIIQNDRIIDCNDEALKLFGGNHEQIIGQTPYRFYPKTQPDGQNSIKKIRKKIKLALQGEPLFFEWRHCSYDGTVFDTEVSLANMEVDEDMYVLAFIRDITQRKLDAIEKTKMERHLLQRQKMEAIGTLAGGIAHDFNNILSSILGFSELVRYDLPEEDRESKENIQAVVKSCLRAKDLVQHILAFSRSAEGQNSTVILSSVIKETVKLLKATLPPDIEIKVQLPDDHPTVFADVSRIHQVVMNLCVNAIHAMKSDGGCLEIRLGKVNLPGNGLYQHEEAVSGAYWELTISDTGHGMREEVMVRVFDPFFTTKKRGEGTGMGLSVVHGIVKDMKGFVHVESELGKGSEFHVLLPVHNSASDTGFEPVTHVLQKGNGRILFVDDEKDIVNMAIQMLQKLGYEVVVFTESRKALENFLSDPEAFDLVMTDLYMPKMNGIDLSIKILKANPDIPVILCTGFSENISPQTLREIGIRELLMKPIIASKLADAVKAAMVSNKKKA